MVKYYNRAAAEYLCNVDEFISTGEGRKLTRLQNLKIRTQYPEVEQWYKHLDESGRKRVNGFLAERYGNKISILLMGLSSASALGKNPV